MIDSAMTCDAATDGEPSGARCDLPATGQEKCPHCEVLAGWCCAAHRDPALISLVGHMLLIHPTVMGPAIAEIAADRRRSALVFDQERQAPERWRELADAVRAAGGGTTVH